MSPKFDEMPEEEFPAQVDMAADADTEAGAGGDSPIAGVAADLRDLGVRFAAALRAAAGTPEAQDLRGEIGEGLRQLRGELDSALEGVRSGAKRRVGEQREQRGAMSGQLRSEVAQAVRNLSAVLERLAGNVEPGDSANAEPVETVEVTVSEVGEQS
jgi:molybdopterin converting factor small subunit